MDIRQLRSFVHAVETGSLSAAAVRLRVTQPALTRQIRLLEEEVGAPLLVRTGRGVKPTAAGLDVEVRARRVLAEFEALNAEVRARVAEVSGTVRIAFAPSIGAALGGAVLERFLALYPAVRVEAVTVLSAAARDALLRGRLDLGLIFPDPHPAPNLRLEPLWSETLSFVAPNRPPWTGRAEATLAEVLAQPLILPGKAHGLRAAVEAAAAERGLAVTVPVELASMNLQLDLVARGMGCSVFPAAACALGVAAGVLRVMPIADAALRRRAVLAWSRDYPPNRATLALVELLRDWGEWLPGVEGSRAG
ncbi:Transcriptional Regulator, LysR family protein [uncultured Alphaproteobacteria bacterium]|uniref:Transcriptional Regulator, LysR family protein n=1 Tax=uncultured Alphaproteobacteria bacterium TaxID=91750 RepID=A0A212JLA8_9PROT|nr:Transcriptional Regulator, LysR family protein [uncultured Alphaproteobacteria bacterium]